MRSEREEVTHALPWGAFKTGVLRIRRSSSKYSPSHLNGKTEVSCEIELGCGSMA